MAWRRALVGCVLLAAACGPPEPPRQPPVPTALPPTATAVPKQPEDSANAFFTAWQQGQHSAMYDLLSAEAQAATPRDLFLRRYSNIHDGVGELKLTVVAAGAATGADAASPPAGADATHSQVPFQVTHTLAVFGDVSDTNT